MCTKKYPPADLDLCCDCSNISCKLRPDAPLPWTLAISGTPLAADPWCLLLADRPGPLPSIAGLYRDRFWHSPTGIRECSCAAWSNNWPSLTLLFAVADMERAAAIIASPWAVVVGGWTSLGMRVKATLLAKALIQFRLAAMPSNLCCKAWQIELLLSWLLYGDKPSICTDTLGRLTSSVGLADCWAVVPGPPPARLPEQMRCCLKACAMRCITGWVSEDGGGMDAYR